jgi:hypothetical protein
MFTNPSYFIDVIDYLELLQINYTKHITDNSLTIEAHKKKISFYPINAIVLMDKNEHRIIVHQDLWVQRNTQVKSRLKSLLGLNKKIHARQCAIMQIEKLAAEVFMNENHIGGYCKSAYKYGLFYDDELYAVATFSKGRKMNRLAEEQRSYELLGFATKANYTIVGGFDKLIKFFTHIKRPDDIMTYVDLEWSDAKSFINLGFEVVGQSEPITFFIDENFVRHKAATNEKIMVEVKNLGNIKLVKKLC